MGFPWFSKKAVHVSDLFSAIHVIDFPFFFTSLQEWTVSLGIPTVLKFSYVSELRSLHEKIFESEASFTQDLGLFLVIFWIHFPCD